MARSTRSSSRRTKTTPAERERVDRELARSLPKFGAARGRPAAVSSPTGPAAGDAAAAPMTYLRNAPGFSAAADACVARGAPMDAIVWMLTIAHPTLFANPVSADALWCLARAWVSFYPERAAELGFAPAKPTDEEIDAIVTAAERRRGGAR